MKLAAFLFKKFKYYIKHYFDPQEDGGYSYQQVRTMAPLIAGVFLIILIFSCNLLTTNGNLGASGSIEESKKRGVFISEYKAPQNPYKINDSLSINVKSAWIEHHWLYAGLFSEKAKIEKEGLQLIIITDEQSIKTYSKGWLIGIDFDKNIRSASKSALITDFETMPEDSIIWKVQKGDELAEAFHKTIIGKFVLVKAH